MAATVLLSAEDLLERYSNSQRCELVAGEIRMMSPSSWPHGKVVGNLHGLLWRHVRDNDLGMLFGAETGFIISRNPDTVRAPDVAFISKQNLPTHEIGEGYWPGAPDLAVEVVSPNDRIGEVDEKTQSWLDAGCDFVWIVNPKARTVTIHSSGQSVVVKKAGQSLEGGARLPGFACPLDELFR
jgi:Uma2 family endonuclease